MVRPDWDIQYGFDTGARMAVVGALVGLAALSLGTTASTADSTHPRVLTKVGPQTNIVKNVGGPHIQLHGLIRGGTDSHTFEPVPPDIRYNAEADLIILNGLYLEVPTEKLASANKKPGTQILEPGDHTISSKEFVFDRSFPQAEGYPNPHLWMNPLYAVRYTELVGDALAALDPTHAAAHQERTRLCTQRLHELDRAIAAATKTIPLQHRKLLTCHDSFAYFAPRYWLTVIGAIEPASFSEPSPRDESDVIFPCSTRRGRHDRRPRHTPA